MTIRPRWVAASRAPATLFLLGTALYAVVVFSSFGYAQFIRPHSITWLIWCATFHDALALGAFSLTMISLAPDVERPSTRAAAVAFIVVWGVVVASLFARPVLVDLTAGNRALMVCAVAFAASLWLSAIDHLACWRDAFPNSADRAVVVDESRLFAVGAAAAVYVWALYGLFADAGTIASPAFAGVSRLAIGRSLLLHLSAFFGVAWLLAGCTALASRARSARAVEYALAIAVLAVWIFAVARRLVLPALEIDGGLALVLAGAFAIVIAASWSGIAVRLAAADRAPMSGFELFARPVAPFLNPLGAALWLAWVSGAAFFVARSADRVDVPLLLQTVCVLAVWLAAWGAMLRMIRRAPWLSRQTAVAASLVLFLVWQGASIVDSGSTAAARGRRVQLFDRYATLDPSFSALHDATAGASSIASSPAFYRFLKANSGVADEIPIPSTPIEFTPHLTKSTVRPPHVFLFVIDSLRPDYLSAYNPAVTFTPAIGALARESFVFRDAFTRYGGTGLAVPSIWAGGLLPHRTYVTPFAPMNALLKLLDANRYLVMSSYDSIMGKLLEGRPDIVELGAESWTARDDMCRVLGDLRDAIGRSGTDRPVFAYSLPQNVHIGYVQGHPIANETYPGFYSALAARVHQVDGCLGRFIDYLKTDGLYDDSVVVITADHGDSIGEGGRWGHGFAGFPEIYRIPLIVHLPPRLAARWTADPDAVSFSTDIVPTLYRVLGQEVALSGPTFGMPLVYPRGGAPDPTRRRGAFLLAASYGPVYAMLQRNGRSLYVFDAVNSRDYAFALDGAAGAAPVRVSAAERIENQRLIREQIDGIAAFFHFDAQR